jgi:hypothetical protein
MIWKVVIGVFPDESAVAQGISIKPIR